MLPRSLLPQNFLFLIGFCLAFVLAACEGSQPERATTEVPAMAIEVTATAEAPEEREEGHGDGYGHSLGAGYVNAYDNGRSPHIYS